MSSGSNAQPAVDFALTELRLAQVALGVDIAQAVLNLVLLIITGVSVYYAFQAYFHQKERAKKDAACDLARYYAHDIIQRYDLVCYTFNSSKKEKRIKELFPYDCLKEFSYKEMENILTEQGHDPIQIVQELDWIDPVIIYQGIVQYASNIEERHAISDECIKTKEDSSGKSTVEIIHPERLILTFHHEVVMLLNDLEWFAMSCRYGLADEEMLYQSLHLTFLSSVWLLYHYICRNNHENKDKLFTNVIWLFNTWADRLREIEKEAQEQSEKISHEIEAREKDLEEAKQKARQMEPKVHAGKQLK